MKKTRMLALLLCLVFCAAAAFSHAFMAAESAHDCAGGHCGVCVALQACRMVVRVVSSAPVLFAMAAVVVRPAGVSRAGAAASDRSPVSLRVRLLN